MIFAVAIGSALALGVGWVLQQRVAHYVERAGLVLGPRLIPHLMVSPAWWAGIAAMVVGQLLGAWSFELGAVALAEPLFSTYLLFAFLVAAVVNRHHPRWHELVGAAMLSAALGVFIAVGRPRTSTGPPPPWSAVLVAAGVVGAVVLVTVLIAHRQGRIGRAILSAASAGVLYGLQDAGTRGALLAFDGGGVLSLLRSPWPYLVVGSAVCGLVLLQSAFGAASLDYSLPPTAAAEPIVGVALGVGLLGDRLSATPLSLAVELLCLLAMVGGVVLIGRSEALTRTHARQVRSDAP